MNKPVTVAKKNSAPASAQSRVPDVLAHDLKDNVAVVVVEGLPKTPTGKIRRFALRNALVSGEL